MGVPKNNPLIEIKFELIPVIKQDERTRLYVAHFERFPRAIAYGDSKDKAVLELLEIFSIMAKEKNDEIVAEILKDYKAISHSSNRSEKIQDVRVYA